MTEKHVYAGNNTSEGFVSFFPSVINPAEANHIYILKGGPGVGKSTFMKKFGSKMYGKDYSVEYIHCSSDDESLDGVWIPELKIALVDGTAPHTIDPVIPGAVDEIINLGVYLDNNKLHNRKKDIIEINNNKSRLYKSAYTYLKCAGSIQEEINSIFDRYTDSLEYVKFSNEVIDKIFSEDKPLVSLGSERKLFSEAFTANGYVSYTDSLCKERKVWAVIGENINFASKLLAHIVSEAIKRGYHTEGYYRPLHPDKLQHVYIQELNLIIKSADSHIDDSYEEVINLHRLIDIDTIIPHNSEIAINMVMFNMLINNSLDKLSQTKKQHEIAETIYKECMDFTGVDECYEKFCSKYE